MRAHPHVCCVLLTATLAAAPRAFPETTPHEILVVAPGAPISLAPAEAGATLEAALDGGVLQPLTGSLEAPAEGDHWLAVAARDGVGNLSPVEWILLRVDGRPPSLDLSFEPREEAPSAGPPWVPPRSRVRLRAEDAPAGVARVGLSAGERSAEVEGGELTLELPEGGEVTLRAWAEDRVGNRSAETELTVAVDARPPLCEIRVTGPRVEGDALPVLGPGAALEAAAEDGESGLAGISRTLDGAPVGAVGWRGPWPPGRHRAGLVTTDRLGNQRRCELAFLFDDRPPEVSWRVSAGRFQETGTGRLYRPPVGVAVLATDGAAGVSEMEWSEDGETWSSLPGALRTSGSRLFVRVRDRVGNLAEHSGRWSLDAEVPTVRLRLPDGSEPPPGSTLSVRRGQALEVTAEDAGSGVAAGRYSLRRKGEEWRPLTEVIEIGRRGRHRLRVEVEDGVGNRTSHEWTVVVGG